MRSSKKTTKIIAVFLGGVLLGGISVAGLTWVLLLRAEGNPGSATLRSVDSQLWRYLKNTSPGLEWVAITDWGQDMVNPGEGLEPVPTWARPRVQRPESGIQRMGTLRAGWPLPWIGAWWATNRRDVNWPPSPFEDDLGLGLEDAAERFLVGRDSPHYFMVWGGLVVDVIVLSIPWWLLLGFAALRGAPVSWKKAVPKESAG